MFRPRLFRNAQDWKLITDHWFLLTAYSLFALLLVACASVSPIAQIGVLAPFEGLYRRSGYSALEVTRAVLNDAPRAQIGLLPLALDTSRDPTRACQELNADPSVRAVVGPLTPQEGLAERAALAGLPWFAPWAITEAGLVDPAAADWLAPLVRAVAADAHDLGATTLAVAGGLGADAPHVDIAALPLTRIDSPLAVRSGDGVLWLGDAAGGARFVAALHARLPGTPIWLAPWAADQVFAEHLRASNLPDWKRIYWIVWLDGDYAVWATEHEGATPTAYLFDRATRQAIAAATGAPPPSTGVWRPTFYELSPSGDILPVTR